MKSKLITFLLIITIAVSCNNSQKNPAEINGQTIEIVAPKAMHEILSEDREAQLIDVRTRDEYTVGHLKNAQNICVTDEDFKEKVKDLDMNKPVYVYCKKGGRSAKSAEILKDMGFTKIYDLQGGLTKWKEAHLEVEN